MKNGMHRGEEVMLMLWELTSEGKNEFTWKTAVEAYASVYGKHHWEPLSARVNPTSAMVEYLKRKEYVHMSLGNLLRGQLKGSIIKRIRKGVYSFMSPTFRLSRPLFCEAGSYFGKYRAGRSDEDLRA